jgi:hypothetical protein
LFKKVEAREVDFYNTSGAEPSSPPQVSDTSIRAAKLEISKQNHSNVEVFAASKPDRMSDAEPYSTTVPSNSHNGPTA